MRPDFSKITYNDIKGSNPVLKHKSDKQQSWIAPEKIKVKPVYSSADLQDVEHICLCFRNTSFPQRPYTTMYVMQPWTVRQYAGFSTAEESNAFYRRNLAAGQKGYPLLLTWQHTEATTRITQG
jgi:methylmalonyl-CoA mutase